MAQRSNYSICKALHIVTGMLYALQIVIFFGQRANEASKRRIKQAQLIMRRHSLGGSHPHFLRLFCFFSEIAPEQKMLLHRPQILL